MSNVEEAKRMIRVLKQLDPSQQMGVLMMIDSAHEVLAKKKRRVIRRSRPAPL